MVYNPNFISTWASGLSGQRHRRHVYDTVDPITTVRGAGYISDATARGMEVGDLVEVRVWTTTEFTAPLVAYQLMVVVSITNGAADLSDGTAITLTNT